MTRRIGQWWRSHKGKNFVLGWLFRVPHRKEIHLANRNGARCWGWNQPEASAHYWWSNAAKPIRESRPEEGRGRSHPLAPASASARNDRGRSVRLNSTPSATSFFAVSANDARLVCNLCSAPSRSSAESNWAYFST